MPVITIPKVLRDKLRDEAAESFEMLLKEIDNSFSTQTLLMN